MIHDTRPITIWIDPHCLYHLWGEAYVGGLGCTAAAAVCPPPRSLLSVGSLAWSDWSDPLQPPEWRHSSVFILGRHSGIQCRRRYRHSQRHARRRSEAGQAVILVRSPFLEVRTRRREGREHQVQGQGNCVNVLTCSEFNFQPCGKMGLFVELNA